MGYIFTVPTCPRLVRAPQLPHTYPPSLIYTVPSLSYNVSEEEV